VSERLPHYRQMHIARHERESERMFEAMRMPIRRQPAAFGQLVATLSEKQDQQAPKNHQKQYPGIPAEIFFAGAHSCDRCRYCRSSMPAIAWVRLYVLTRGPSSEFDAPRIVRLDS